MNEINDKYWILMKEIDWYNYRFTKENWLPFLYPGWKVRLCKEKCYAEIIEKFKYEKNSKDYFGVIEICRDGSSYIETWHVSIDGKGFDGSQIMLPSRGDIIGFKNCDCDYCISAPRGGPDFPKAVVGMTEMDAIHFLNDHNQNYFVIIRDGNPVNVKVSLPNINRVYMEVNGKHVIAASNQYFTRETRVEKYKNLIRGLKKDPNIYFNEKSENLIEEIKKTLHLCNKRELEEIKIWINSEE